MVGSGQKMSTIGIRFASRHFIEAKRFLGDIYFFLLTYMLVSRLHVKHFYIDRGHKFFFKFSCNVLNEKFNHPTCCNKY